jgi:hypothetical protein
MPAFVVGYNRLQGSSTLVHSGLHALVLTPDWLDKTRLRRWEKSWPLNGLMEPVAEHLVIVSESLSRTVV